jgi:pimeloyl-ACP methyl ester carboxylesterase
MHGVFDGPDPEQTMAGQPQQHMTQVNGIEMCWFEWGERRADAGTTLLVHATGFHARCWDRTVAHLDGHIVAVDMRGHGRSSKTPPYSWESFGADVAALVTALDLRKIVGAGHSMGGHSVTQAAAHAQDRFERLVLVDPVIMSPEGYAQRGQWMGMTAPEDHPTAKRRNRWASVEEMVARFGGARSPFAGWQPEVIRDYCEWGLLPAPDGDGFVLACPPVVEASVYIGSSSLDLYALIDTITLPVTVLRAPPRDDASTAMDFSKSPTWPGLAGRFRHGRDVYLPERTHFIPMEDPALTADYIAGRR